MGAAMTDDARRLLREHEADLLRLFEGHPAYGSTGVQLYWHEGLVSKIEFSGSVVKTGRPRGGRS